MMRIYLAALLLVVSSLHISASPKAAKHTVKKGETLYSISRTYSVKVGDIVSVNPSINSHSKLKPGQQLVIPNGKVSVAKPEPKPQPKVQKPAPVPSTPNTPYRDEDERGRANVESPATNATASLNDEPVVAKPVNTTPVTNTPIFSLRTSSANAAEYGNLFNQYGQHGYRVKKNRGAANYLADNTSGNPYLALYNDAEIGSVIKVTNMMNNKTIFVKVVGKVPVADAGREVLLKLSNKAAHELGAIDEKFLVEVAGCTEN